MGSDLLIVVIEIDTVGIINVLSHPVDSFSRSSLHTLHRLHLTMAALSVQDVQDYIKALALEKGCPVVI